jgi:hypothetical protein
MLGANVNWVRNLKAAGGHAVLRHGRREHVRLEEVEPGARAPILRRYLEVAPGARPHIPGRPDSSAQRVCADRRRLPGVPHPRRRGLRPAPARRR